MNTKEKILSVYRKQSIETPVIGIYNRYHRLGEVERIARNHSLGILDFIPVVSLMAPPWHIKPGYISEVKNSSFSIKLVWDKGSQIEVRIFETPVGTLTQQLIKDPAYGSDWIQKHYLESLEDFKIMQYIIENTIFKPQENTIRQHITDLGNDGVVLGRMDRSPYQKLLTELANPENFLTLLYTDPDPVDELIQTLNYKSDEQFSLAMQSMVDVIWQPDNVTADMTPPDMYEKYVLPFYKKHGAQCREAGKPYVVHIDGRTNGIKELIAKSDFDVIESYSFSEMGGDTPVQDALKIWKNKVLCPNFPASLCLKSENEILEYLKNKHMEFSGHPYMMQISEDIPIDSYLNLLPILSKTIQ